jgi:hypothetical protein
MLLVFNLSLKKQDVLYTIFINDIEKDIENETLSLKRAI